MAREAESLLAECRSMRGRTRDAGGMNRKRADQVELEMEKKEEERNKNKKTELERATWNGCGWGDTM